MTGEQLKSQVHLPQLPVIQLSVQLMPGYPSLATPATVPQHTTSRWAVRHTGSGLVPGPRENATRNSRNGVGTLCLFGAAAGVGDPGSQLREGAAFV